MEIDYQKISRLSHLISKLYETKWRLRDLNCKSKPSFISRALAINLESDVTLILKEIGPLINELKDSFGIKINDIEEMRNNLDKVLKEVDISKSYTGDDVRRILNDVGIDEIPF